MVKETVGVRVNPQKNREIVSIPYRGSGKGDKKVKQGSDLGKPEKFQSPLGEVVKETNHDFHQKSACFNVSIPYRGSGKGDTIIHIVWK